MDERSDILISRVVDGVASAADLAELETVAASRPGVWRELALAQRDQALLSQEVARAISAADVVGLPVMVETHHESLSLASRWKKAGVWGGWAAAAAMALAYVGVGPGGSNSGSQASLIPSMKVLEKNLTADQAWQLYEATGSREQRLIGVLPERVLIEATPSEDGKSIKMVFVRQLVETQTVDGLYKGTVDEAGKRGMVKATMPALAPVLKDVPLAQPAARRRVLPPV